MEPRGLTRVSTFSILRLSTPLCSLELETGTTEFHKHALHRDGQLVLSEQEKVGFAFFPCPEETEHLIVIGDVPLGDMVSNPGDANGRLFGDHLIWSAHTYFESARGCTRLHLASRPEGASAEAWKEVLALDVIVLPSKLGDERYRKMADDLQEVSRSLLVDLYGKSKRTLDVRYATEGKVYSSREQELAAIDDVVGTLSDLLPAIGQRPASRVISVPSVRKYRGGEPLSPTAVVALCRNGLSPLRADRPLTIRDQRKVESFDVAEHRVTRAFLEILMRRAGYCANAALGHIRDIESERDLRDIQFGPKPSLYETVDVPRIKRLQEAVTKADQARATLANLSRLPFLRESKPELMAVREGSFQRSPEYRVLLTLIRRFLFANAIWYEGEDLTTVTKLTSRLFEQWCFLRLVNAFREAGLHLREWNEALRQNLQSRFILDFDRGLSFDGLLTENLKLRLRYEPWILGTESAVRTGETLSRGSNTDAAWSPDIVIECLTRNGNGWRPVYGVVLDCKYTARVTDQQRIGTEKYFQIRCTATRRQIVKQLWLISPATPENQANLESEDPAVNFGPAGPSCLPDDAVRFRLTVAPDIGTPEREAPDVFIKFARGTTNFLLHYFGVNHKLSLGSAAP